MISQVLAELDSMGFKNLTLASSALLECHDFVVDYINSGLIRQICASVRGAVGDYYQTKNECLPPLLSNPWRARSSRRGGIYIYRCGFRSCSACDKCGNMTGMSGPSAFGSLGYGIHDARFARHVIAVTDNLVEFP